MKKVRVALLSAVLTMLPYSFDLASAVEFNTDGIVSSQIASAKQSRNKIGSKNKARKRVTRRGRANFCPAIPNATRLADKGTGYKVPHTWSARGLRWGTRNMVSLISRAAEKVRDKIPQSTLYVADLSYKSGNASQWHRTHRHGTDVDLLFYATTMDGDPAPPPRAMVAYNDDGHSAALDNDGNRVPKTKFDVARNWHLVRALLEDNSARVERILISNGLRKKLLDYAKEKGAPARIVEKAEIALLQPPNRKAHDDHMHVRIARSAEANQCLAMASKRSVKKRVRRAR